ncbi:MAG TPA: hypothetical protein VNL94_08000 [Candidatus Binatia bacterium]|nr:hypothetical protein [Candidatus Binatia bacterium]
MHRLHDRARRGGALSMAPGAAKSMALGAAPVLLLAALLAACGGGAPATPTAAPSTDAPATAVPPTEGPTAPTATDPATGPAHIEAPTTVGAGVEFDVEFTGPNASGDYITIVKAGATKWTNEPYFYTNGATSPQKMTGPTEPGAYQLWYVDGDDDSILFRFDITVEAFVGSVDGPDEVGAGTIFEVSWTGPNGPGDYVTIVKSGATRWTNEDYFYTTEGNPGTLQAPIEDGAYELWYVLGADDTIGARAPITVLPVVVSLTAPETAVANGDFEVAWTGPDGAGDFITIVEAGAPEAAYLDYCYTRDGPTCTLTAPDATGAYEVRYVTGQNKVIATRPIQLVR